MEQREGRKGKEDGRKTGKKRSIRNKVWERKRKERVMKERKGKQF